MVYGVPRSRLPYPAETIKAAILRVAAESVSNPEFVQQLKVGYMMLATFIDDEAAAAYEKVRLAFAAAVAEKTPFVDLEGDFPAAAEAQKTISEEMKKDRMVLDEELKRMKQECQ